MIVHQELAPSYHTLRETRGRLCRLLLSLGYKVIAGERNILFERRKPLGFLPGSPPRAWKTQIFAVLEESGTGCDVLLRWEVSTKGRVVSVWDVAYLKSEIESVIRAMAGRDPGFVRLEREHSSVALKSLGIYLAGALTLTVATVLVIVGEVSITVWALALFIVGTLIIAGRAPTRSHRAAPKR